MCLSFQEVLAIVMKLFGVVTVSDRASEGVYDDISGPAIIEFFQEAIKSRY